MKNEKINWDALAGTRFVLAFVVFVCHLGRFIPETALMHSIVKFGGFSAVMGFFLISGFSIRNSISTKPNGYLLRRFYRIWPCYFVAFVLSMLPFVISKQVLLQAPGDTASMPTMAQFFGNLLMLQQNFCMRLQVNGAPWSLAIEETYYLLALGLILLPRRWTWRILAVSFLFYAMIPFVQNRLGVWTDQVGPFFTVSLLWCWLLGWLLHENPQSDFTKVAVVGLPLAAIAIWSHDPQSAVYAPFAITLASGVLICSNHIHLSERMAKVARYLGDISYPLYISHLAVLWMMTVLGFTSPLVFWCAPFLAAIAMYHLVDKPMRGRWRKTQKAEPITTYLHTAKRFPTP